MASQRVTKALIPAAGRGTRFLPLTKSVPKELAPLVSTPALEFVVAEASARGITDVVLVLSEGKAAIRDYFAADPGLEAALEAKGDEQMLHAVRRLHTPGEFARLSYVEQRTPRGLGDAVAHGEQFVAGEAFAVLLPDDIIDDRDELLGPMLEVQAQHGGIVLGLIDVPREEIRKYGCVAPADGADVTDDVVAIADLVEKPQPDVAPSTLAIIGRYVLPPEIFDALRATAPGAGGEIQLTDAMRELARAGTPVHGVVFRGRRYDTGDRLEYVKAVMQIAARHPDIGPDFVAWLREYVSKLD
ncbi:MAG TPA: UTP--glucose-1-phosphate uridylyltransferase [Jatrophihabitantaceae bacterium]|nr:UTP--glucose-1-phosphate uridylyltransferase [Jatrophihabitantaceae bacterium]